MQSTPAQQVTSTTKHTRRLPTGQCGAAGGSGSPKAELSEDFFGGPGISRSEKVPRKSSDSDRRYLFRRVLRGRFPRDAPPRPRAAADPEEERASLPEQPGPRPGPVPSRPGPLSAGARGRPRGPPPPLAARRGPEPGAHSHPWSGGTSPLRRGGRTGGPGSTRSSLRFRLPPGLLNLGGRKSRPA